VHKYVEIGSGEPIESENLVEFHLLYSGPLHSAGSANPRKEKHAIRKVFHSQLRHLWMSNSNLRRMADMIGRSAYAEEINEQLRKGEIPSAADLSEEDAIQKGLLTWGKNWNRNGFNFLPLVAREFCLRCCLDILFLRVEDRNYVLQGGDIDGRIKILFDSLRMADSASELPPGAVPEADENPFFCLLENDDLISEVRVNTDRLLNLPGVREVSKSDVYLQITVRLNPTMKVEHSWAFE